MEVIPAGDSHTCRRFFLRLKFLLEPPGSLLRKESNGKTDGEYVRERRGQKEEGKGNRKRKIIEEVGGSGKIGLSKRKCHITSWRWIEWCRKERWGED